MGKEAKYAYFEGDHVILSSLLVGNVMTSIYTK